MVRANHQRIRHDVLCRLADAVWDGAGKDIEQFVEIALSDNRFPI